MIKYQLEWMSVTVPTSIKKKTVLSNKVMKESDYPGIGRRKQMLKKKKKFLKKQKTKTKKNLNPGSLGSAAWK